MERRGSDGGDAGRDREARQAGAGRERPGSDGGNTGWERDARQAGAARERRGSDAGDAGRDRDARQFGTVRERLDSDGGDAGRDRNAAWFASRALDERGPILVEQHPIQTAICGIEFINSDARQAGAVIERRGSDGGDAGRDREARQAVAA